MYKYIEKLQKQIFYIHFYTNYNKEIKRFTKLYNVFSNFDPKPNLCGYSLQVSCPPNICRF